MFPVGFSLISGGEGTDGSRVEPELCGTRDLLCRGKNMELPEWRFYDTLLTRF